jgi:uncharacterized membrane protein YqjE
MAQPRGDFRWLIVALVAAIVLIFDLVVKWHPGLVVSILLVVAGLAVIFTIRRTAQSRALK